MRTWRCSSRVVGRSGRSVDTQRDAQRPFAAELVDQSRVRRLLNAEIVKALQDDLTPSGSRSRSLRARADRWATQLRWIWSVCHNCWSWAGGSGTGCPWWWAFAGYCVAYATAGLLCAAGVVQQGLAARLAHQAWTAQREHVAINACMIGSRASVLFTTLRDNFMGCHISTGLIYRNN